MQPKVDFKHHQLTFFDFSSFQGLGYDYFMIELF